MTLLAVGFLLSNLCYTAAILLLRQRVQRLEDDHPAMLRWRR